MDKRRIRILLVDDHAMIREGLRAMLSLSEDLEVIGEAGDGNQAIESVRSHRPDVVIMDIAMPGMDGLEATQRILRENPDTKVLILSQHDNDRYILPALRAGASGYVCKRSVGAELIEAIRTVRGGASYLPPAIADLVLRDYRQQRDHEQQADHCALSEREKEVLRLVAEGRTSQEIADLLSLSKKTVMSHRANIMTKLGMHNRADLIKYAIQLGLTDINM